jgi:hypothetical protein
MPDRAAAARLAEFAAPSQVLTQDGYGSIDVLTAANVPIPKFAHPCGNL